MNLASYTCAEAGEFAATLTAKGALPDPLDGCKQELPIKITCEAEATDDAGAGDDDDKDDGAEVI